MIKIRMTRGGRTKMPTYTLVAIDSRNARDGKFLEKLGMYRPNDKKDDILQNIKVDSVNGWLKKGAQLSDTVRTLFKKHKITLGA